MMPVPADTRKKPADVQVHVTSGAGVDIAWADGHTSHYAFDYLRERCPCATCGEERRKKEELEGKFTSSGGALPQGLPIFKPKPRARNARAVGHYALQMDFTDGHSTGIYSFEYLRDICPCEQCRAASRSAPTAG